MRNNFTYDADYNPIFQAYVVWVDHNGTLEDKQKKGVLEDMSPQTGRNIHIGVIKLNGQGAGIAMNVVVPVGRLGEFRLPKVGDVVWIEESRRHIGATPVYLYSTYNTSGGPDKLFGYSPVPQWGSMPGDSGEIISYRDHIRQFVPTNKSNFTRKFVKSVTGHRFRQFYRSNLKQGRFAVRGDVVFDIDGNVSVPILVEEGAFVGYGGKLETDQGEYPNPLNTPAKKEEDEDYTYYNYLFEPIDKGLPGDQYSMDGGFTTYRPKKEKQVLKNKNYISYQPVMDKKYLEYADFEREIPAAEEYQVAIRGNNKLLIQDQYGDGEQLLITLKNQFDSGITIVHNGEKGQVRIRDSMGQGVLLEANPDAPRVMLWTANRQVIEQGAVKDKGEFTYIRNGAIFGDSQTSYGTKTGLTKDDVSNQEFLMVSTSDIIGELSSRLSSGMNSLVGAAASPGVYMRNNVDPEATNQNFSMYKAGTAMTITLAQENTGLDGSVQNSHITQTMDGSQVIHISEAHHAAPGAEHKYLETVTVDNGDAISIRSVLDVSSLDEVVYTAMASEPSNTITVKEAGAPVTTVLQDTSGISVKREAAGLGKTVNIANDSGTGAVVLGSTAGSTTLQGTTVTISGAAVNIEEA